MVNMLNPGCWGVSSLVLLGTGHLSTTVSNLGGEQPAVRTQCFGDPVWKMGLNPMGLVMMVQSFPVQSCNPRANEKGRVKSI